MGIVTNIVDKANNKTLNLIMGEGCADFVIPKNLKKGYYSFF